MFLDRIFKPSYFLSSILLHTSSLWPDELFVKLLYRLMIGKHLNLSNPQTYNEKLQWLKLYNRKPEYSVMVDKVRVKEYVASIIGEDYIIPTLGVWEDPDNIDFDSLPQRFVIKCNHNSGTGMCICKNKNELNVHKVRKELRKGLKENYYLKNREWPYKNIKKLILAETYLEDPDFPSPSDYKVMCFNGKVKMIEYHEGRFTPQHTQSFYNCKWEKLPINQKSYGYISNEISKKPALLEKMIELSEKLAIDIPHVRIDFPANVNFRITA